MEMSSMTDYNTAQDDSELFLCPKYEKTFDILGKRWNALIIDVLAQSDCRFSELSRTIEDLSDRVLTERLHELEQLGIVEKNNKCSIKSKFTYQLTQKGLELSKALDAVKKWAENWIDLSK